MFDFGTRQSAKTVTPDEVRDLLAAGAITLVDVREDGEWQQARIAGAIHKPLSRFRDVAGSIPTEKPVVFHCLSGARSGQAITLCKAMGLPHDTHMAGGLTAWQSHGLPIAR